MKQKIFKCAIIGVLAGLVNGLLGAGGGMLVVPALERFLGVEEHKAYSTAILIILSLTIVSVIIYIMKVQIDWKLVAYVASASTVGSLVGAKYLKHIPKKWLHRIFGIFIIIAGVGMLLR